MTQAEQLKVTGDVISLTLIGATLTAWLPPIAAAVSIVWGLIRIYETKTVQAIVERLYGQSRP